MLVPAFVGGREVGHQPAQLEPRVLGDLAAELAHLVRVAGAEPAHARVVLHVYARACQAGAAVWQRGDKLAGPRHHVGVLAQRHVDLGRRERAHHEDPGVDPPQPEPGGLGGCRHGQPAGASGKGGTGALRGPVAVAVGLHHGAQLRAIREELAQAPAVALDGAQVHPGDGALGSARATRQRAPPGRRPW